MTLEQQTLLGETRTIVDGRELTPRQQIAWDMVLDATGGVDADEVGARLHMAKGKHHVSVRCQWCAAEGASVLRSKALSQLVSRKRATGRYHARDPKDAVSRSHSPAGGLIATSESDVSLNPWADL